MRTNMLWGLCLAAGGMLSGPLHADEAPPAAPAVIIRVKAFDNLLKDLNYVGQLAGKSEEVKQIDGILQSLPVKNGLAGTGLDTKRPFYFYAIATPDAVSSYGALLVPIADEKAFMSLIEETLGAFGVTLKRSTDKIHSIGFPNLPFELFFTIADRYAYITGRDRDAIAPGRRFSPEQLAAGADDSVVAATVRIDRIPDMLKQLALSQLELHVADAREKKGGETPAQTKFKSTLIEFVANRVKGLVRDGSALDLRFNIDRESKDFSVEASLTGKPGSDLAKDIADLGQRASLFASALAPTANFAVNLTLPEQLREPAAAVLKEGFDAAIKNEHNEKKRVVAQKAVELILPIVKAGRIDAAVGIRGSSAGKYTFSVAVRVPDSAAIEDFVKEKVAAMIPAEERNVLTLNAAKIDGQNIHRIAPPRAAEISTSDRKKFGEHPSALIGFPKNRVLFAIGADPAESMKTLLAAAPGQTAPPVALSMSIAKMAPLIDERHAEAMEKAAKETFADAPAGSDLLTFTIQGGPSLKIRYSVKALGVSFFTKVQELNH